MKFMNLIPRKTKYIILLLVMIFLTTFSFMTYQYTEVYFKWTSRDESYECPEGLMGCGTVIWSYNGLYIPKLKIRLVISTKLNS